MSFLSISLFGLKQHLLKVRELHPEVYKDETALDSKIPWFDVTVRDFVETKENELEDGEMIFYDVDALSIAILIHSTNPDKSHPLYKHNLKHTDGNFNLVIFEYVKKYPSLQKVFCT